MLTLGVLMETCREGQQELNLVSVDLEKTGIRDKL